MGRFDLSKKILKKCFTDYAEKYSSSGTKEVLIKSVAYVIPTYSMDVFKFSSDLCEDLMKLTKEFWWGDENERRRMHCLSWVSSQEEKVKVEWVFGVFTYSTKPCLQDKHGALLLFHTTFVLDS